MEPKSRAGRRGVPIVAALRDLLVEHKLVTRRDDGVVFGSSETQPFTPTAVRRRALTAWRRTGLEPIGLHECRHTFASLLIAAGVNAKAITRLPRPRIDPDDVRPVRAPHAGQRGRGSRARRRLPRAGEYAPPARTPWLADEPELTRPRAQNEAMTADAWSEWWSRMGEHELCVLLLRHWDVVRVRDIDEQPEAEYAYEAARLGELLRGGASRRAVENALRTMAADMRVDLDHRRDARAAESVVAWYRTASPS